MKKETFKRFIRNSAYDHEGFIHIMIRGKLKKIKFYTSAVRYRDDNVVIRGELYPIKDIEALTTEKPKSDDRISISPKPQKYC